MLRTVVEDREGIYLRKQIAFRFYEDAFERIKRLGVCLLCNSFFNHN